MIFTQNEKMRLDRFLSANLNATRSQIAQLIAKNAVQINGKVANKRGILLKIGDEIEVDLMDSRESLGESRQDSRESNGDSQDLRESLPKIMRIYEDNDFLVLNKPPFLATHGAPSLREESLVEWLKAHKIQLSTISGEKREGIIHRLDKQTSGAIVVAKNNRAHRLLSAQLADKSMGRIYLAIIDLPLKCDIEVECYLARNPKNRLKISKVALRDLGAICGIDLPKIPRGARYAKSKFFKLATSKDGKKELICAQLFTGRTHQIRAHLESINRHIVGDELYGYKGESRESEKYRVFLHSYLLYLTHPRDFCERNSSLAQSLRELEKSALDRRLALSRTDFSTQPTNLAQDTRIANDLQYSKDSSLRGSGEARALQSKPNRHTEHSEVSKTRESSAPSESMTQNRINKLDSPLQYCDSYNLDSRGLDSSLRTSCFAQNDEVGVAESCNDEFGMDCFGDKSPRNDGRGNSTLQHCDSSNLTLCDLDSSLRTSASLRMTKSMDCFGDKSPRNDENIVDSSLCSRFAQNDKLVADSPKQSKNPKTLFLAPLFDDMQSFLEQHFDMGEVNEILRTLPNRFDF